MQRKIKKLSVLFLSVTAVLPLISRFDLLPRLTIIPFTLLICAILLTTVAGRLNVTLGLVFVGWLCVTILASYWGPLFADSLFVFDQHIGANIVERTISAGHFPEPERNLRGSGVTRIYPLLYSFGAIFGIVLDFTGFHVAKFLPMFVLPGLPLIGAATSKRFKFWLGLLWLTPVFFSNSAATTVAQMFALPTFGIIIVCLRNFEVRRFHIVFIIAATALTVTHSVTPIIGGFVALGFFIGTYLSNKRDPWEIVLTYWVILTGLWVIMNHFIFIETFGSLLVGGVDGLFSYFQPPAPPAMPGVSMNIPVPIQFWVGLYLRFYFLIGVVILFIVLQRGTADLIKEVFDPDISTLWFGIPPAFTLSVVLGAVNFHRSWLMVTLASSPAVVYLLCNLESRSSSKIGTLVATMLTTGGLATLLLGAFYHLSSSGPLSAEQGLIVVSATIVLLSGSAVCYLGISVFSRLGRRPSLSTHPLRIYAKGLIVIILVGHLFIGVSAETFSSEAREEAFHSPGLTKYHQPWDYSTARFASEHTDEPVVGDFRVFLVEEYYRQNFKDEYECYRQPCNLEVIVWYDVYRTIWQGIDLYGPVYTKFPDGERFLDSTRSKIYSTGHSAIYV